MSGGAVVSCSAEARAAFAMVRCGHHVEKAKRKFASAWRRDVLAASVVRRVALWRLRGSVPAVRGVGKGGASGKVERRPQWPVG